METSGEDDDDNERIYWTLDWDKAEEQICEVKDPVKLLAYLKALPDETTVEYIVNHLPF